ncbi:MAG: sulfatase-like hydrolase/transferase [Bdellovibrionaceae bacterium]|nr:sulfatase-like hydrolase/transferase [Bdellovibrio sp.]
MWILAYFIVHLVVYFILRLQFLFWNWPALKTLSLSQTLQAFLYGIRFDLSALAATSGLFLLGAVWIERRWLRGLWFALFTLINSVFILLNLGDSELINFTARRFSKSSFFLLTEGNVANWVTPYLAMTIFSIVLISTYAVLNYRIFKMQIPKRSPLRKVINSLVVILVVILSSRGGFQTKPLTFVDAKIFNNTFANNLVLNSTFTFVKSLDKNTFERSHFFDNETMLSLLNEQNLPSQITPAQQQKMNIVLIILESFSTEYTQLKGPEATPFFNQLRARGVDFTKSYANSRRSIEGIAALLSGIPALMEEPFINSEFSSNQLIGLGTILTANKYHTSFFHGAKNGSMHFDQFTKSVGIQNYFGKTEYGNTAEDDGTWGIYDEPFLQWTCQQYNSFPQPFFSVVFTISSHQPYNIPAQHQKEFSTHKDAILNSIQYADYSLDQFMKCAEKQAWYHNTLFILTADHTGPELNAKADFESRFKVPLVFFHPNSEVLKNLEPNQWAQHIDVLPTLLETLGIPLKNKNSLARSLWQKGPKVIALYADRKYQLVGDIRKEEEQLKAVQQYFSEGLYDNRLYYPSK